MKDIDTTTDTAASPQSNSAVPSIIRRFFARKAKQGQAATPTCHQPNTRYNKTMRIDHMTDKRYSISTGKLHVSCPHPAKSGISIHVVVKDGCCYRANDCMVFECKFNPMRMDIERVLSVSW